MKRVIMRKRHYLGILCCLIIMACQQASPSYEKTVLKGNWLRINSTDIRSDSMTLHIISGDSAVITSVPPNSNFFPQQLKWRSITPVAEFGDFQIQDLSADGNWWKAFIIMESDTRFQVKSADFPNAPGGKQTWEKL